MANTIKLGNLSVDKLYLGVNAASKIYLGDVLIYPDTSTLPSKGQIITMDLGNGNKQYRVINISGNIAEVLCMYEPTSIRESWFYKSSTSVQTVIFTNGISGVKYAGSNVDNDLNNIFYNSLSAEARSAIVPKNINQDMWTYRTTDGNPVIRGIYHNGTAAMEQFFAKTTGYADIGMRNIYCLSMQEIADYVMDSSVTDGTFNDYNISNMFLEGTNLQYFPWLRSATNRSGAATFSWSIASGRIEFFVDSANRDW